MKTTDKLKNKFKDQLFISVGLDTDIRKIPNHLLSGNNPVLNFNKTIIENTYEKAAAYKINFAFYERNGAEGIKTLEDTLKYIPGNLTIIADAKRGDIGNTAEMYAKAIFDQFNCDAVTLHPYMGFDSIKPFLNYSDKLSYILGLTSNAGAADFEKLKLANGKFLYQEVIDKIIEWNKFNNLGVVFGATNLEELNQNLEKLKNLPVLLPGIGAQGGNLEEIIRLFKINKISDFLINISRGLIYADNSIDFGKKISEKLDEFNNRIQNILNN